MRDKYIQTAESVTGGHPDKLCDTIADRVLDACLKHDPSARVACEVMATAGKIIVAGEITADELPDIPAIVCQTVREAGYGGSDYEVEVITHDQSGDIARAVSRAPGLGAGDQGIMYGYACSETEQLLPLPVVLAHRLTSLLTSARVQGLIHGLLPDGKSQVSVEYQHGAPKRVAAVVLSCQHSADKDLAQLRSEVMRHVIVPAMAELPLDPQTKVFVNPSGRFTLGGFEADTGLTGRKLMVDTYGGLVPHGGGALSGKDGTKVDRSRGPRRNPAQRLRWGEEEGMERVELSAKREAEQSEISSDEARYIAKNIVAAGLADRCTVSLAYAIGRAEPVAVDIDTHGTSWCADEALERAVRDAFDLTPSGIIRALGLDRPIFARYCNYGHFTHQDAPWEQTDKAEVLAEACGVRKRGA